MNGRPLLQGLPLVAATIALFPLGEARADEPAVESSPSCDAAFEAAELGLLPSEGRLLDARAALRACSLPSCKSWMIDDCSKRLVEVEGRIPSVAFSAEDARGRPLYDVRVLEGDRELLEQLNGRAVEMDPGPHELVAERRGVRVTLSVIVTEGKKAQQVVFSFPDDLGANEPKPPIAMPKAPGPRHEAPAPFAYPWARPFAGGLLLGAVVASGVGLGFGAAAMARKDDARCDSANLCESGSALESARESARAATASFVIAGALAIGSAATFVLFGRTRVHATASFRHVHVAATW